MFQITPSASAPSVLSSGNGNIFQVCFTDPNQGIASAQYIAENKLAKKIGIIYDSSDVYSSGIEEKFEAEAKDKGLQIVSKQHLQQILRQTLEHSFRKQKMQVPIYSSYLFTIRKLLLS